MCLATHPRFLCKNCLRIQRTIIAVGPFNITDPIYTDPELTNIGLHVKVYNLNHTAIYVWELDHLRSAGREIFAILCPKCSMWVGYIPPGITSDQTQTFHLFTCMVTLER